MSKNRLLDTTLEYFGRERGEVPLVSFERYRALEKCGVLRETPHHVLHLLADKRSGETLVLKKSRLRNATPLLRRFNYFVKNLLWNRSKRSHTGASRLLSKGFATLVPLHYWRERSGRFRFHHCFLYRYILADSTALESYQATHSKQRQEEILRATATLSRSIHLSGIRHSDLALNNFLITDWKRSLSLAVIDTDRVTHLATWPRTLHNIRSMYCLRRIDLPRDTLERYLSYYFDREDIRFYLRVLELYRWWDRRPISRARRLLVRSWSFFITRPWSQRFTAARESSSL